MMPVSSETFDVVPPAGCVPPRDSADVVGLERGPLVVLDNLPAHLLAPLLGAAILLLEVWDELCI